MRQPYTVEVDKPGCDHCGTGCQWTVVGPDDVAIGQSFEDKELADDIADYMNMAFDAGKLAASGSASPETTESGT